MPGALAAPFAVAALVLCAAGLAKLRSPVVAAQALAVLSLPARPGLIRAYAACEIALGAWCVADPGRPEAGALALLYAVFAGLALALARRHASCGCFGAQAPASPAQAALSALLSLACLAAVVWPPHGLGWMLNQPLSVSVALLMGIAGAAYATVLAYSELPSAWSSWSGR